MKKGKFAGLGDIEEIGGTAPAIVGGEALEVELALLDESPHQLRIDVSNIEELAASLESVGLIQPITLEVKQGGRYTIVAGHRRVEAARHNGWQTIKAVVVSPQSEADLAIKNLVENVQRDDLSPFELALAVDRAIAATGQKASDFAKTIGKSVDWLSKVRSVLRLPSSVQDSLALELTPSERRRLGVEALSELSRLEDEELCVSLFEQLKKGEIKREGMREAIREAREPKVYETTVSLPTNYTPDEILDDDTLDELAPKKEEVFKTTVPFTAVVNIPIKTDAPHTEPQTGKIGKFWEKHTLPRGKGFGFDFSAFSEEQKAAFLSDLGNLCQKYSNMEIVIERQIKNIGVFKDRVCIEYDNGDMEYPSFTKAKEDIYKKAPKEFGYECADHNKAVDFVNSLRGKYSSDGTKMKLRDTK